MKRKIAFLLNMRSVQVEVKPQEILLDLLRDRLGVKSPKCGCDRGDCGSCSVMIDEKTVRSCMVLAIEVEGRKITTIEGLVEDDHLTPLQQSFIHHNSFQCGFCAPGIILSATELLKHNTYPNEEQIKEAIAGNLCRCTGYQPIIDAIRSLTSNPESFKASGRNKEMKS